MGKMKDIIIELKLKPEDLKQVVKELNLTTKQFKDREINNFALDVAYRKQTGKWFQYWNGNGYCEINKEDGTMITTVLTDEPFKAEFPLNCDMNISNNCCIGCEFCYQGCTPTGKHSNIKKFIEDQNSFLYTLREGTELAINGNEPFHPDLELLLQFCKERNILANLTVNEISLFAHKEQIEKWLEDGLIHGVGISPKTYDPGMIDWVAKHPTAVIHTIVGITSDTQYKAMYDKDIKVLILGYKDFGRGVSYKEDEAEAVYIKTKTKWLKENVNNFVKHFKVVSFDNLAIEQLNPKQWLSENEWAKFYRGDDGSHTLFIDLVDETYAMNSVQTKEYHKPLLNDISAMLKDIQASKGN